MCKQTKLCTPAALRRLATERNPKHLSVFVEALGSGQATLRAAACDAIGWLRNHRNATLLLNHIEDPEEEVRYAAVANLALCGGAESAQALATVIQTESSPRIRARAARIIGFLKLPYAETVMNQLITEDDDDVKAQLVYTLGQLKHTAAISQITSLMASSHIALKIECIRTLSQFPTTQNIPETHLNHDDPHVRIEALRHLIRSNPDEFCTRAAKLFRDKNPGVRCTVVIGLKSLGTKTAAEILMALPKDPHPEVRRHLNR